MTITPVPVRPATAAPGARDDRPAGDPVGFAALVSRETDLLAGSADGVRSGAVGGGSGLGGGTADAAADEVPADAVPGAVVVPGTGAVSALATAPGGVGSGTQGPGEGAATGAPSAPAEGPGAGPGSAVVPSAEVGEPGPVLPAATTPTGSGAPGTSASLVDDPAAAGVATSGGAGSDGAAAGGVATDGAGSDGAGSEGAGAEGADAAADAFALRAGASAENGRSDQGMTSTGSSPAVDAGAAPGTVAPTTAGTEAVGEPTPSAPAARSTALLDQVSPTLTRLVSRGDGDHRMTLKIHPADLGEVHLTVTVRGERVDVDIAASAEARELLRDGLTQLRAVLDPTGRGGGQLVFRDLPQAPAGQPVAAETGTGGDPGDRSGVGDGSAESHDRRGQPSGPAARTPGAADPAPTPTVAPTRSAGTRTVDLTI